MVASIKSGDGGPDRLVITPHAALSAKESVALVVLVSIPIIAIAVICGLLGVWYVLPVSLSVCVGIAIAFRSGYRRTQVKEVVSLVDRSLAIERGHRMLEERYTLPSDRVEVVLEAAASRGSHLFVCVPGRRIELGRFLEEEERCDLAQRLRRLIVSTPNPSAV